MKYDKLAKNLVAKIGKDNINDAYHCITRLRISVKNQAKIDLAELEKEEYVKKAQFKGNELQIVIGQDVHQVYEEFVEETGELTNDGVAENVDDRNFLSKLVDALGGIFVPILPAFVAGGMGKSIITILNMLEIVDPASDLAQLLNIATDSVFYFLPFFIAVTAAKVFKTNELLALMIAGSLMYPTLTQGLESGADALNVFGVSIPVISYSGSVFPIIFGVGLLSIVYRFLDKKIHENVRIIFAPLLAIMITVPLTLAFLAPLGHYLGAYLAQGITWIYDTNGIIASLVFGAVLPVIIMGGMHQSIFPIILNNLAESGVDTLLPTFYLQTLAIAGASYAVFVKSKNTELKSTALSTGISATFGITEPALYGIAVPLKTPFIAALISSGVGSALSYILGVRAYAFALPSFLSIPTYVNEADGSSLVSVIIASVVTLALGFGLSYVLMKREETTEVEGAVTTEADSTEEALEIDIYAPVNEGKMLNIKEVKDDVFAEQIMGPTIGIKPGNDGTIYAPVDAKISLITETKHAIGLQTTNGLEILLHFGIDTVKIGDKPFTLNVQEGDYIRKGDVMGQIDLKYLAELEIDDTIIVAITNNNDVVKIAEDNQAVTNDTIIFAV